MAIPWINVKSWLGKNRISHTVSGDAAMQRIRIDLKKRDDFGGFDRTHALYASPSATAQNLGSFSESDINQAAQALRISWP